MQKVSELKKIFENKNIQDYDVYIGVERNQEINPVIEDGNKRLILEASNPSVSIQALYEKITELTKIVEEKELETRRLYFEINARDVDIRNLKESLYIFKDMYLQLKRIDEQQK